jgi:hypothetical protein
MEGCRPLGIGVRVGRRDVAVLSDAEQQRAEEHHGGEHEDGLRIGRRYEV